jgi:hypothetical protein
MSYKLTITPNATYLHAVVTGVNSIDNVVRYLGEIQRECVARNCFRVLIEERLDGPRLSIGKVFRIASQGSDRAQGKFEAIAFVDLNAEGDSMEFAETVAVNRSLPVKMFDSISDAERWLLGKDH